MIEHDHDSGRPSLGRRRALRTLALAGAAFALIPGVLAACGDDDDSGDAAATTAAGAATTAAGSATTAAGGAGECPADPAAELATMLEIPSDPKMAGAEVEFPMGAVLALTGPGSFYGKTMSRGIDLAVEHVKAAGGPTIKVDYYDHKSGDAAAGKQAITELGAKKVPAKLASYVDNLGSMFEGTQQYKVFTLDGGGGTSEFGKGIPFFWGTRAITPNDTLPGVFQWFKETSPDKKTVGLVGWDVGEPSNTQVKEDVLKKIADAGLEFNGLYELVPVGTQDYAAVLPKIKANEPDLLLVGLYGQDPGAFRNQQITSGIESQIVGFEFTPDGVNASKGTYDSDGWTFAYDYFDATQPKSPLAKLFVCTFEDKYGELPDFYAANFYENTLVMWEVIRRVLAKGGNPLSGEELDQALQDNLTVVSVYGGDDTTLGSYTLDPTTHSVQKREMGVFEYKDGKVTPFAFFGIGGDGFQMAG